MKIFVGNLSETSEEDLREAFKRFGEVTGGAELVHSRVPRIPICGNAEQSAGPLCNHTPQLPANKGKKNDRQ